MISTDLSPVANHLWQSTLFAAAVWALMPGLRKNHAALRYRRWLVASVKFLIPFSLLVSLGGQLASAATVVTDAGVRGEYNKAHVPPILDGGICSRDSRAVPRHGQKPNPN